MRVALALLILALTVGLSLLRPRVGGLRVRPSYAALLGACLTLVTGLLTPAQVGRVLLFLGRPVVTIVSLMAITLVAERAGFFRYLAWRMAKAARGDARRLFTYVFGLGTCTGALFTNDAAVLIFTPMIHRLVEEVQEDTWEPRNKACYYFAVLYVANLVGPFVISNPINIIVSDYFDIGFLEYAAWMLLPAGVSIVATYVGMRVFFRESLPRTCRVPGPYAYRGEHPRFAVACAVLLALTLLAFFSEGITGVPTAWVAAASALALVVLNRVMAGGRVRDIARGIGWRAILFVVGIFVVANALRVVGMTALIGHAIESAAQAGREAATFATSLIAAVCSAVLNNHPVAGIMALAIGDMAMDPLDQRAAVFAALIGGDLGPKMLPIGSLAALLWFQMLRARGVRIAWWQYVRMGVPVTLLAVTLATLTLVLEVALFR